MSAFYLLAGLLLTAWTGYRLVDEGVAFFPVVAVLAGAALIVVAVIGLMSPPRHSR
ncbi:hypothetical protein Val02_05460 [Virgisporangium aliadipatigenens]|uniref:Uncharacterized protein n=1 Tax=Virgisporangium aliadipatigenens TaxID=741659 RepID=A0A8J4DMD2_9ACTN|nr:hypothetical protein [Virgisporangium aliadipatigenens]GIJ43660.1 hypothetical protein Val02_05460 [Virgisporangium aliadipatigenens]